MARTATVITPELEAYASRIVQNLKWLVDGYEDRGINVAKDAGMYKSTLDGILSSSNFPALSTLVMLGRYFDVDPGEFFLTPLEFRRKAGSEDGLRPFEVARPSAREVLRAIASEQSPVASVAVSDGRRDSAASSSSPPMKPETAAALEAPAVRAGVKKPTSKSARLPKRVPGPLLVCLSDQRERRRAMAAQTPLARTG